MWSSPVLVLMLVLGTLYASLFHAVFGRSLRGLLVVWVAAIAGMAVGQLGAEALSWRGPMIGELHLVTTSLAAWLAMVLAWRLKL